MKFTQAVEFFLQENKELKEKIQKLEKQTTDRFYD